MNRREAVVTDSWMTNKAPWCQTTKVNHPLLCLPFPVFVAQRRRSHTTVVCRHWHFPASPSLFVWWCIITTNFHSLILFYSFSLFFIVWVLQSGICMACMHYDLSFAEVLPVFEKKLVVCSFMHGFVSEWCSGQSLCAACLVLYTPFQPACRKRMSFFILIQIMYFISGTGHLFSLSLAWKSQITYLW